MSYYSPIIEGDSRNCLASLALTWWELISGWTRKKTALNEVIICILMIREISVWYLLVLSWRYLTIVTPHWDCLDPISIVICNQDNH